MLVTKRYKITLISDYKKSMETHPDHTSIDRAKIFNNFAKELSETSNDEIARFFNLDDTARLYLENGTHEITCHMADDDTDNKVATVIVAIDITLDVDDNPKEEVIESASSEPEPVDDVDISNIEEIFDESEDTYLDKDSSSDAEE